PVAETNGIRVSLAIHCPTCASPLTRFEMPSGYPFSLNMFASIFWQAIAHNGVFSDGFHIMTSPQTNARAAFHDQTATGKLNALMIPTMPSGWYWSYMRWPGRSE